MSEVTADENIEEEMSFLDDEPEASTPKFGRKTLIFGAAGALALLIVIGAGIFFAMPLFEGDGVGEETRERQVDVVFFDLPQMVVNLASNSSKRTYLKIQISLELDKSEDIDALQRLLPRVIDHFQVYLRELRADDLHGSAGIYRLKEELLRRVSAAARPVKIRDVLFKEMLIQ